MKCSECKFIHQEGERDQGVPDLGGAQAVNTFCRRNPPQLLLVPGPQGIVPLSMWPSVHPEAYCGEFAPLLAEVER